MIRSKYTVGLRNTLSSLAASCDSAAAIEQGKLTGSERNYIQNELRKLVKYIDEKIKV